MATCNSTSQRRPLDQGTFPVGEYLNINNNNNNVPHGIFAFCLFLFPHWTGCPHGWTSVYQGSCYYATSRLVSFSEAIRSCKTTPGAYLVEIQSPSENTHVAGLLTGNDIRIGYSDQITEGKWIWSNSGVTGSYTNWLPDEPNDHRNQDCARIWGTKGRGVTGWDDVDCGFPTGFVCETGKQNWDQILSFFSPTKILVEELTAWSDDKTQRSPGRQRPNQGLANAVARSNRWATKPQQELRAKICLSPSCQFFFIFQQVFVGRCVPVNSGNPGHLTVDKERTDWRNENLHAVSAVAS